MTTPSQPPRQPRIIRMPHTMDAIKAAFSHGNEQEHKAHKDKLAQNKLNERDIKEWLKEKREKEKDLKHEAMMAESKVFKMERAYNPASKRAAKEIREEKREERDQERKEAGVVCEHGVYKCRICHPVTKHK